MARLQRSIGSGFRSNPTFSYLVHKKLFFMDYKKRLQDAGIRCTSVRLLVYRTIYEEMQNAFSLQDVMDILSYADSSSVFRALTLFAEHHLLHLIDDGSGVRKYCVCRCGKFTCHHLHFTCIKCHETTCLKDMHIPAITAPEGYVFQEAEFVIKGICPKCQGH